MKRIALSILVIVNFSCAHAADWEPFAYSKQDTVFYWRPASAATSGTYLQRAWVKSEPKTPQPVDEAKPQGKKYQYAVALYVYSCAQLTLAIVSRHEYSEQGVVLWSHNNPMAAQEPALPDTIGEQFLFVACPPSR